MATGDKWTKRVQRWNESDLTANEFAAELGINAQTLSYWNRTLAKEAWGGGPKRSRTPRRDPSAPSATFVEVTPSARL